MCFRIAWLPFAEQIQLFTIIKNYRSDTTAQRKNTSSGIIMVDLRDAKPGILQMLVSINIVSQYKNSQWSRACVFLPISIQISQRTLAIVNSHYNSLVWCLVVYKVLLSLYFFICLTWFCMYVLAFYQVFCFWLVNLICFSWSWSYVLVECFIFSRLAKSMN